MTQTKAKTKLQPLGNRILVKRLEAEAKSGGIILPDSAKKKQETAQVLALGTGANDEKGNKIPFTMKVNDKILMDKYAGQEVTVNDEELVIVNADDVIAIVE